MSRLKKVLLQSGHTNPTPRCTFLTWAQIAACEVDGPSLQPSTWHWYTHLAPPSWILRGCMSAGMSPSGAGVAAERAGTVAWPAGPETSGPVDSWGGCWGIGEPGLRQEHDGGGWDTRGWEHKVTPLRSPYKPSTSDPTMASLSFPHPSVSNCWASASNFLASSLFTLACWSCLKPYKEGGNSQ